VLVAQQERQNRITSENRWEGGEEVAVSIGGTVYDFTIDTLHRLTSSNGLPDWSDLGGAISSALYAWHPASYTYPADQSIGGIQAADFVRAEFDAGDNPINSSNYDDGDHSLVFVHSLAKVVVKLNSTTADLSRAIVRINGYTSAALNAQTGELTGSAYGKITPALTDTAQHIRTALILPRSYAGEDLVEVQMSASSVPTYYRPAASFTLEAGKSYLYNLTFDEAMGTAKNPAIVMQGNWEESVQYIADHADDPDLYVELGENIVETGSSFTGFGDFAGHFNGNDYAVTVTLTEAHNKSDIALFGTNTGYIQNLHITSDASVTGTQGSIQTAAAIAALNQGTIIGCKNEANIFAHKQYIGGIAATNDTGGRIIACYNLGNVKGDANGAYVGGIAGLNKGQIIACFSGEQVVNGETRGIVTATHGQAGGDGPIVGRNSGTISNSYYHLPHSTLSTTNGATPFSATTWPVNDPSKYWGIGGGSDERAMWKSTGSWNSGTILLPQLWWE
jgi:hypothetical protein